MMRLNEETGEITTYIGDSGKFSLTGLPTSCDVYFSIYNENKQILNEQKYVVEDGTLTMFIPAEFTDVLTVPKNDDSAEYYYGIKLVYFDEDDNRIESTCTIGNHSMDEHVPFIVYAKRTEGGKTLGV